MINLLDTNFYCYFYINLPNTAAKPVYQHITATKKSYRFSGYFTAQQTSKLDILRLTIDISR
jgi:hypothetical protein